VNINPQVMVQILQILAQPPVAVELALSTHFPSHHASLQSWAQEKNPDFGQTYDFISQFFPNALKREDTDEVGFLYRELHKCIIASALGLEYKPSRRIVLAH
jgi:hypothetical protein